MNKEIANKILQLMDYSDYEIISVYESSFRALRKNEYILSELNVDVVATNFNEINEDNVYSKTSICVHVLKRYQ